MKKTLKNSILSLFTMAVLGLVLGHGGVVAAQQQRLTFVHLNDLYEVDPIAGRGGFLQVMTALAEVRAKAEGPVLVTFGGDLHSPSLLSSFAQGAQMIDLANAVPFDAAVFGNHEFDFGVDILAQRMAASHFPWLADNLTAGPAVLMDAIAPAQIIDRGGVMIGLIGLVTPQSVALSRGGSAVSLADPVFVAPDLVAALRSQGADLVVALTHLGFAQDRALAREVAGIDLILGGHDHNAQGWEEGVVPIIKAGSDGRWLAQVLVERDGPEEAWRIAWTFSPVVGFDPDPAGEALLTPWRELAAQGLDRVLGCALVDLDSRREVMRGREGAMGDLVADAMRWETGADIAIMNGGGIRGDKTYPAGQMLTQRDILTELPFNNLVMVLEVSGATLHTALEHGVAEIDAGAGRMPQVSGLSFVVDPSAPAGHRVSELTVAGVALTEAGRYRLATNDYLGQGGDGYDWGPDALVLQDAASGRRLDGVVADYLSEQGPWQGENLGQRMVIAGRAFADLAVVGACTHMEP